MKFINLMHSDPTLINMMLFGVEGDHWEFEDDGRVNLIDSAWYGAHAGAWTVGNTLLQAVSNKEDPDKNRMLIEYSDDSIDHPSLGFRFRTEPVAAELTAVTAVAEGTTRALMTGYVDPADGTAQVHRRPEGRRLRHRQGRGREAVRRMEGNAGRIVARKSFRTM